MSDGELSDGIAELQELMAEYETAKTEDAEAAAAETVAKKEKKPQVGHMEVPMDKIIFGDKDGLVKNMKKAVGIASDEDNVDDADDASNDDNLQKSRKRKPVWTDPDDEALQLADVKLGKKHNAPSAHLPMRKNYKDFLQARFARIMPQPKWADLNRAKSQTNTDDVDSDDEELLHTVGFLAKPQHEALPANYLRYRRLKDLNRASQENSISCIEFHPSSTAALVAGKQGYAAIYAVDGRENAQLHSMYFQDFPIKCMKIMPNGNKAIFGSNQKFYYHYDLLSAQESRRQLPKLARNLHKFEISPCGKYMAAVGINGHVHLFDANANELLHSFRQHANVGNLRFTADSRRIVCSSRAATVSIFSLQQMRLEHEFVDDGCIKGLALDLSANQRMLATGSQEGAVNVYDFQKVLQTATPTPEKTFLNLKTAIADIKFNHSSELLAMCTAEVKAGIKLAHFPTGTVFANFPEFESDLGYIRTLSFSPQSAYLALGSKGKVAPLLKLKHFKNY